MRNYSCILILIFSGCHSAGYSGKPCNSGQCQTSQDVGLLGGVAKVCIGPDEWKTKQVARNLANRNMPRGMHSHDFKAGFRQAFEDVAMGASGEVPPLPPKHYWKERTRTCNGHAKAEQWFEGYAAGAQIALSMGQRFLDVATGYCGTCQPSSVPNSTYY